MANTLAYYVHVTDDQGETHVFGPGSDVPAWARKKITNPSAWVDGAADTAALEADDEETDDEGGDKPYSDWKVPDLKAEIEKRNAGRGEDDQIVPEAPGNKPELVAALEADDEETATEGGDSA